MTPRVNKLYTKQEMQILFLDIVGEDDLTKEKLITRKAVQAGYNLAKRNMRKAINEL